MISDSIKTYDNKDVQYGIIQFLFLNDRSMERYLERLIVSFQTSKY